MVNMSTTKKTFTRSAYKRFTKLIGVLANASYGVINATASLQLLLSTACISY